MKNEALNQTRNTWRLALRFAALCVVTCLLGISSSARGGVVAYSYDALNRLTRAAYLDNTAITYNYDSVDNWTTNAVTVMTDSDGDGIPDWWMNQYFGHPTGQAGDKSRANDDADGDSQTNLQEYLAGTNPLNPSDTLRISSATKQGNDMVFSFSTATNRMYVLEWTTDLKSGSWTSLSDIVQGDGTVQQWAHVGGAALPQRFYRLRLLN